MLNWRSSSIDMSFHPYPSEIKDLTYDFNYFKIVGILHINMWHVAKHFIVLWHVTISFSWSLSWHLGLHCVYTNQSICSSPFHWKPIQYMCAPFILMTKVFQCIMDCCHVVFKDWLYAMYVSTLYIYIDEHNKNEL